MYVWYIIALFVSCIHYTDMITLITSTRRYSLQIMSNACGRTLFINIAVGQGQASTFPTVLNTGYEASLISDACESSLLAMSGNVHMITSKHIHHDIT